MISVALMVYILVFSEQPPAAPGDGNGNGQEQRGPETPDDGGQTPGETPPPR